MFGLNSNTIGSSFSLKEITGSLGEVNITT
jgi:hypothetical protein